MANNEPCRTDYEAEYTRLRDKYNQLMEKYHAFEAEYRSLETELVRLRAQMDVVYLIFGKN